MTNTRIFRLSAALLAALLIFLGGCTAPGSAVSGPAQTDEVQTTPPSDPEPARSDDFATSLPAGPAPALPPPSVTPKATPTPSPTPSEPPSAPPDWIFPTPSGAVAEGEPVEESWFSDAVFVGDSRTDGLRLYSGIKSADFICHQGLSVFTIGEKECIKLDGKKVTALDALAQQQYAKVYLMLGVNELGYPTESYRTAYAKLVREIRELQPDAVIYLQTLPPVNEPLAQSKGISKAITNEKLIAFNQVIAEIAESEETALVTVDELFWTEQGELAEENTTDGVHFTRKGYETWFEYLKSHTGTTEFVEFSPEPSASPDPALPDPDVSAEPSAPAEPPLSDPDVSAEPSAPAEPDPSASEGADQTTADAGAPAQG